jgi:hypothetical protein
MNAAHTSEVLKNGIGRVLDTWRDRFGGADDPLQWVLRSKLADAGGARPEPVPAAMSAEVARSASAIGAYFDNVRYALLDPLTMVWGTLTNALRVAAGVDSVTDAQRATFSFPAESLAAFFRAAHHDLKVADALWHAFKPMPAADCQVLAALFNVHMDARLDGNTVVSLVRVLGNEGPLTSQEEQALGTLKNTGLAHAPFRGTRGGG